MSAYRDRDQAGEVLAAALSRYAGRAGVRVLGLVRGGVPVAARVARELDVPLDALVVRKLGVPWAPEVAFGALGPGGVRVLNAQVSRELNPGDIARVTAAEATELSRREAQYRDGHAPPDVSGQVAIVVDDGLATGATAQAAVAVLRRLGATRVVLAAPVGSRQAVAWLRSTADEVVCPLVPKDFGAVSRYFDVFDQVPDDAVVALLAAARPG